MKKIILSLLFYIPSAIALAQTPNLDAWHINWDGTLASGYETTAGGGGTSFQLYNYTDEADVQRVCYSADSIWIKCTGLTTHMGQFQNPGAATNQNYVFRIPRNPAEAAVKTETPTVFSVGVLLNGIPIFALGDGKSYTNVPPAGNSGMGDGIWNGEAMYSEGTTLDTAFGAHPQQDGGYHTHGSPFRMYDFPSTEHSPIIGFAFDGFPIYGPYGYIDSLDANSGVQLMVSGYEKRTMTVRHTLADGTVLSPSQYGPDVDGSHPVGEYIEDYEHTNAGTLDEYNGRYCVTPEYPAGTYAYFTTVNSSNVAQFPYFIGTHFYGTPELESGNGNFSLATANTTGCVAQNPTSTENDLFAASLTLYPNPATSSIASNVSGEITIRSLTGYTALQTYVKAEELVDISSLTNGLYLITVTSTEGTASKKVEIIH